MKSEPLVEEMQEKHVRFVDTPLQKLRVNVVNLNRLVSRYGLYSNHYAHQWLHEVIADKCHGNGRATFAEFRQLGYRDLYITAVNISRQRLEIFSVDDTPQVSVADAVLMSGTIPLYFEALQFDGHSFGRGDYYVDGGLLSNLPIHVFDHPKFENISKQFTFGINWETLGCRQFTPMDCPGRRKKITNLLGYAESVFESMAEVQNVGIEQRGVDQYRSISISNCCVSPVDFDLKLDEMNPKYVEMVLSGEQATREYLKKYKLPTDRFVDIKEKLAEFLEMWR
jgi:NTE family protein